MLPHRILLRPERDAHRDRDVRTARQLHVDPRAVLRRERGRVLVARATGAWIVDRQRALKQRLRLIEQLRIELLLRLTPFGPCAHTADEQGASSEVHAARWMHVARFGARSEAEPYVTRNARKIVVTR